MARCQAASVSPMPFQPTANAHAAGADSYLKFSIHTPTPPTLSLQIRSTGYEMVGPYNNARQTCTAPQNWFDPIHPAI